MTPFLDWITCWNSSQNSAKLLRSPVLYIIRGIIRNTDEWPDDKIHKVRSGSVLTFQELLSSSLHGCGAKSSKLLIMSWSFWWLTLIQEPSKSHLIRSKKKLLSSKSSKSFRTSVSGFGVKDQILVWTKDRNICACVRVCVYVCNIFLIISYY